MSYKTLKMIAVSRENYLALKRLGSAGDSFNDVITEVLKKVKSPLQTDSRVGRSTGQSTAVIVSSKIVTSQSMEDDSEHDL
jgi:predicted CopG family antitoxin